MLGLGMLALAACGGMLADDEKTTSTNDPHDGGASTSPPSSPPSSGPDAGPPALEAEIASLAGLALWLDATKGISLDGDGSGVAAWADQSPEHNDLVFHEGHGARANESLDAEGGSNAVFFDGSTSYAITPSAKLASWGGDFFVAAVVRPTIENDFNSGIFGCYGAQPSVPGHTLTQFYVTYAHHAAVDVEADGYAESALTSTLVDAPVVLSFWRAGSVLQARRNGVVEDTQTFDHTTTPKCTQAFVGALPADGTSQTDALFTGWLAELVVVQGRLDGSSGMLIEQGLLAKYNLH
ncbi:MAG TPA: hypothetical protein VF407_09295 [Polyangiaceae bacterium]